MLFNTRPPRINSYYWAEKIIRLSWANDFISLNEVQTRLSSTPIINGRLLYIVNTDIHGNILSMNTEESLPEDLIGFYTDGQNFALAFLWRYGLKESPECLCMGQVNPEDMPYKTLQTLRVC